MRRLARLLVGLPGCFGNLDSDYRYGGAGGSSGGATACSAGTMPGTDSREMASVALAGGKCFWIDKREVTASDYAAFLASSAAKDHSGPCAQKSSFDPDPACVAQIVTKGDAQKAPRTCVDWCDAQAYCAWAGKRLCGGVDTLVYGKGSDPADSLWYAACSGAGTSVYPYPGQFVGSNCNTLESSNAALVPVSSVSGCVTPTGISDLSGNAQEWVDECNATIGPTDQCHVRGGSYVSGSSAAECGTVETRMRGFTSETVGFRCCGDPPLP
jgi:formylglycine-generating enzyme required for sulfatase activity